MGSLSEEFCLQRCENFRAGDDAKTSQGTSPVCWMMTDGKHPSGPGPKPVREITLKNWCIMTSQYGVEDLGTLKEGLITDQIQVCGLVCFSSEQAFRCTYPTKSK